MEKVNIVNFVTIYIPKIVNLSLKLQLSRELSTRRHGIGNTDCYYGKKFYDGWKINQCK